MTAWIAVLAEIVVERITTIRCADVGCDDCHATWLVRKRRWQRAGRPVHWTRHADSCPVYRGVLG